MHIAVVYVHIRLPPPKTWGTHIVKPSHKHLGKGEIFLGRGGVGNIYYGREALLGRIADREAKVGRASHSPWCVSRQALTSLSCAPDGLKTAHPLGRQGTLTRVRCQHLTFIETVGYRKV